mmetsp:Transcript_66834/g.132480  ORF Transcript_66834/g.132480 Transcript_66834/m.132480 type:complete len:206 (+) Transcript_66834:331-948(+)
MKTSPRIHSGPAGGGTSRPMNPEMHSSCPPALTLRTYCSGVRIKSLPARVIFTSGIVDTSSQSTVDSPSGLGRKSQTFSIVCSIFVTDAFPSAALSAACAASLQAKHWSGLEPLPHLPIASQISSGVTSCSSFSIAFLISVGPYCSMAWRHSSSKTPMAPIALLISLTAALGPARSEVPESAIALHPPLQKSVPPTITLSIANSQ